MIKYHDDLIQGSDEWHAARCGLLTASEFGLVLTPTLKIANNDKTRQHAWELAAQRITNYVEPTYIGEAMLRGHVDEMEARNLYSQNYAPVQEVGFVTNDKWGFTLGCSPDGLVGDDGMIECKSRIQKYQIKTIVEHYESGAIPAEYVLQIQGQMLVTGRKWCDFISYSGGLPMWVIRVEANPEIQDKIIEAASSFEARVNEIVADYHAAIEAEPKVIPTERTIEQEMII